MEPETPSEQVATAPAALVVRVTDPEGSPVVDGTVTLTGASLLGPRTATTDAEGWATFSDLPAGELHVLVERSGARDARTLVTVASGRRTLLHVELPLAWPPSEDEEWWWSVLPSDGHRGTFLLEDELWRLPVHLLGGAEGLARHPGLGAGLLPTDPVRIDGRPYGPAPAEIALAELRPGGVILRAPSPGLGAEVRLDAGPGLWRVGGLAEGTVAGDTVPWLVAGEGGEGLPLASNGTAGSADPAGFATIAWTPADQSTVDLRARSSGSLADAELGLRWRLGGATAVEIRAGALADLRAPASTTRAHLEAGVGPLPTGAGPLLDLSGELLTGTPTQPTRAALRARGSWWEAPGLEVDPAVAWRHRGDQDRAEAGVDVGWAPTGRAGLFGSVGERWEGIDTDDAPLVARDELALGAVCEPRWGLRVKISGTGALRRDATGRLPPDASLQLAMHRPGEHPWGLAAAATWRPLTAGDALPGAELGALATWSPLWRVRPVAGLGLGATSVGGAPLQGQAAGRVGVEVHLREHLIQLAVEGNMGRPTWTTDARTEDIPPLFASLRVR